MCLGQGHHHFKVMLIFSSFHEFKLNIKFSVILFDLGESHQDEWYSTQNDEDDELGSKKWGAYGNPFEFYVCQISGIKQDNFLRTPFIYTHDVTYVYVNIQYRLSPCTESKVGVQVNNCAQSFHLHMKEVLI